MPNKTFYIRKESLAVWKRAESVAGRGGVSRLIEEAVRRYLEGLSNESDDSVDTRDSEQQAA